jgi:transposase
VTGDKFLLEMPFCSTETFQQFLKLFSEYKPTEYKIIVLDNGAFHKARRLIIPQNITLLFLPPYSPELNPAEKIWQNIKRKFTNKHFANLNQISEFFSDAIQKLTNEIIISTCSYEYISLDSFWSQ